MYLNTRNLPILESTLAAPQEQRAVVLVGHGSVRSGAGVAMLQLAEQLRAAALAPIVAAGFLNYSRPTFAEALDHCADSGAREVVVQPYFLVPGKFVREDLPSLVDAGRSAHPQLNIVVGHSLGDHPAMARLVLKRALEADYLAANPRLAQLGAPRPLHEGAAWQPLDRLQRTGLLVMAHGSPDAAANEPIHAVAQRLRAYDRYAAVTVCFMDLNQPSIAEAIDDQIAQGITAIVAVPYFLHLGNHVLDDLPAIISAARDRHPAGTFILADHLAYDRLLIEVIADRVAEALPMAA